VDSTSVLIGSCRSGEVDRGCFKLTRPFPLECFRSINSSVFAKDRSKLLVKKKHTLFFCCLFWSASRARVRYKLTYTYTYTYMQKIGYDLFADWFFLHFLSMYFFMLLEVVSFALWPALIRTLASPSSPALVFFSVSMYDCQFVPVEISRFPTIQG